MSNDSVIITGMGHEYPQFELDNQFFENLEIETSAQWIEERTGIKKRQSVLSPQTIQGLRSQEISHADLRSRGLIPGMESLVSQSWQQAVARSGSDTDPVWVVSGSSVPDYHIPSQANIIAAKLNLNGACLDVNTACSSFISNLAVCRGLAATNGAFNAAVFNVERYTTCLDYKDRNSCVLFGDGSACAILAKGEGLAGLKIVDVLVRSNSQGFENVQIPVGGYFSQHGARVQKFAISKTCEVSQDILARNQLTSQDLNYFIGHQANYRMLSEVCRKLQISPDRHLYNVDVRGNQGAAGAPCVLSLNWEKFKKGDRILVSVVGSGLTWGSALLECV